MRDRFRIVIVGVLAQHRLERVERLARTAGASEDAGDFSRIGIVFTETRPVFLECFEGGAVVPAPRFGLGQLDPDRGCAGLDAEVTTVGVDGGVGSSGPGADSREVSSTSLSRGCKADRRR